MTDYRHLGVFGSKSSCHLQLTTAISHKAGLVIYEVQIESLQDKTRDKWDQRDAVIMMLDLFLSKNSS